MRTLYFDYNATTPLDPLVRGAMLPFLSEEFGNPSSVHHVGRRARAALDDARERAARVLDCRPGEVLFTSGGTESNNTAILGAARLRREAGRHLITSAVEHHAVLNAFEHLRQREGFDLSVLPVDSGGRVDPADLQRAFRSDTVLVSIMAANNETGTLQTVAELGHLCRERGILFHTDAVQCFGKMSFTSVGEFNADLVSLCAHKFHGPKGVGALYIRSPVSLDPLLFGGPQESERRAGTENLAACIGLAEALERFVRFPVFPASLMQDLTGALFSALRPMAGVAFRGAMDHRLPNTLSLTVEGCDSISLLAALDLEGICASSGSACSAGSVTPSHVLRAMGVPLPLAASFLRFSFGRESTSEEVSFLATLLPKVIERIRYSNRLHCL